MLEPLQSRLSLLKIEQALASVFTPPPRLTISEWADEYRELSREANAKGGRWQSLPWQRGAMDAVLECGDVCFQWASQVTGKTEVLNNIVGYFIAQDPAPMLMVQPTLEMGEAWSKDRLSTMLRDTAVLRGKVADARSRDSGNTILHKTFPGGHITICGANSPAGLASRPIRIVLFDEVDRYDVSAGAEGDPISLAEKRTESFWNAVTVKVSTPTIKGASRIEREIELSDKRKWHVPCEGCGEKFVMEWAHVVWPDGEPEKGVIRCPKCRHDHDDAARIRIVKAGEWIATAPFRGKAGFILNGLVCLFPPRKGKYVSRLHQMIEQFREAKAKGKEALRVWVNTFLAETFEDEGEKTADPAGLFARREDYGDIPENGVVLVAGADVQTDRIEAEIVAFGQGEESWGIEYRVFHGNIERWEVWNEFDQWLQKPRRHASGVMLQVAAAAIDSGHKPRIVQAFVDRCSPRRVFAVKGVGTSGLPWVTRSKNSRLLLLKVSTAKESIYSRLKLDEPGPGYMHFPKTYDEEYFRQLTAERVITKYRFGLPYRTFDPEGRRNEALDCRVYAHAALFVLNPAYAALAAKIKKESPVTSETPGRSTAQKQAAPRRRFSVTRW